MIECAFEPVYLGKVHIYIWFFKKGHLIERIDFVIFKFKLFEVLFFIGFPNYHLNFKILGISSGHGTYHIDYKTGHGCILLNDFLNFSSF